MGLGHQAEDRSAVTGRGLRPPRDVPCPCDCNPSRAGEGLGPCGNRLRRGAKAEFDGEDRCLSTTGAAHPAGYHEMTEDEQEAAAIAMWREAMVQIGNGPDGIVTDRATSQDGDPATGHESGHASVERCRKVLGAGGT